MTLAAVEQAALATAHADAEMLVSDARAHAAARIATARNEAAALIEERRTAAERLAEAERQMRLAAARGEARANVLAAQQSVLADATTAAHSAARRLVSGARYGRLVERLTAEARERLESVGPVQILAAPGGGVRARAGSREIDYSLDAQVDRWLEALPEALERLWE